VEGKNSFFVLIFFIHCSTSRYRQDAFYENYFESQRDHIFRSVELLIYVFDIESREIEVLLYVYNKLLPVVILNE
jgi:hypothetical protein